MSFNSLQRLLRSTLALSQFCAIFPVKGILAMHSSKLRFRWWSVLVVYWLAAWVGLIFIMCRTWTIVNFRNPNGSLSAISNFTLLRVAVPPLVVYPLFLQLSHQWPQFVHLWELIEDRLKLRTSNRLLSRKIFVYTVTFAALRFLFYVKGYVVAGIRIIQCEELTSPIDFVNMLFQVRFPQVFSITSPTPWKYFLCAFLELTSTWSWLCAELIVLDLSLILLEKFKTFNSHLKHSTSKISPQFWYNMRREYVKLALLTSMADCLLSPLIFSIVILETMLLILFIYLVLTHAYTLLSYSYFLTFFLSHVSVDVITLVTMAAIFDESKKPLAILHKLPSAVFSQEVRRLYAQVKKDTVALTGCKFFVVTQTAILSIISALVTYEVLLVQLGNLKHDTDPLEYTTESTSQYCKWIEKYLNTKGG